MVDVDVCGGFNEDVVKKMLFNLYGLKRTEGTKNKLIVLLASSEKAEEKIAQLKESDIVIINDDIKHLRKHLLKSKAKILTYGLNQKAWVTTSSVSEDENRTILCCIQRKIPTFGGNEIEEQEFTIQTGPNSKNIHTVLACVTAAMVCDVDINVIERKIIE